MRWIIVFFRSALSNTWNKRMIHWRINRTSACGACVRVCTGGLMLNGSICKQWKVSALFLKAGVSGHTLGHSQMSLGSNAVESNTSAWSYRRSGEGWVCVFWMAKDLHRGKEGLEDLGMLQDKVFRGGEPKQWYYVIEIVRISVGGEEKEQCQFATVV